MKKTVPDKPDIIFGTNGPHVSELTAEEWSQIINHAVSISTRLLKHRSASNRKLEIERGDFLKTIKTTLILE